MLAAALASVKVATWPLKELNTAVLTGVCTAGKATARSPAGAAAEKKGRKA